MSKHGGTVFVSTEEIGGLQEAGTAEEKDIPHQQKMRAPLPKTFGPAIIELDQVTLDVWKIFRLAEPGEYFQGKGRYRCGFFFIQV